MRKDIVLGKLPDPFMFENGKRVQTLDDWKERRKEIIDKTIQLEFDGMPPKPDKVYVEQLSYSGWGKADCYRAHCIVGDRDLTFCLTVYLPKQAGKYPIVLTGDQVWYQNCSDEVIEEAHRRNFIVVKFNRNEFAPDIYNDDRDTGAYWLFEGKRFSAVSAWAWGYHRAVDALLALGYDYFDFDNIAITGHSRGGKAVLLAGATDERVKFVNPNGSGAHGCGCYHFMQVEDGAEFNNKTSEPLSYLFKNVPYWMGDGMRQYIDNEGAIPHDMHFIKALVAPRYFLETNGHGDLWANPRGSYITHLAAKEVFKLYGKPENCKTWYRDGGHRHGIRDFTALFDFMESVLYGKEFNPEIPYTDLPNMFDWTCPEEK